MHMGAATTLLCNVFALLLCLQLLHTPSQAFKLRVGGGGVGGYEEKKVPLAVIVPDPSPELSGQSQSPSPLAAPPPVHGGGGDDMRPKLPTERWHRASSRGEVRRAAAAHQAAPAAAPSAAGPAATAPTTAAAPAPDSGGATASIKSSPAVPVPRGVTDTATILPMPAPGEKRQQEVGAASSVEAAFVVPLMLGIMVMMASFGIY